MATRKHSAATSTAGRSNTASADGKSAITHSTAGRRGKTVARKSGAARLHQTKKRPALRDVPDIRDRLYEPTLRALPATLPAPRPTVVLDQGEEGACTGFALAAAINHLMATNANRAKHKRRVSAHMLYAMARRYDEWPGEDYEGSSLRGALRGFYNCGACADRKWEARQKDLTLASARDARNTTLGAYYRLRPNLSDYHAAINETGIIYVSANVHDGWADPRGGHIEPDDGDGAHAFIIIGYSATGFWIQNSWGKDWGKSGLAHWLYTDWSRNIIDAWVLQLAVPAPTAFGLGFSRSGGKTALDVSRTHRGKPHRQEIAGHFVHLNNGRFSNEAPYWSSKADISATAEAIAGSKSKHFLFYAHGGLNSPEDAAIRTAAMIDGFSRNGVYPYSVFYDTGMVRTLKDIIISEAAKLSSRTGGFGDFWDMLVENAIGPVGKSLWREMKRDARLPFEPRQDGEAALAAFIKAFAARKESMPIHLVGHSTGGVLIGHLLEALERIAPKPILIDSISLMAPACSVDFYQALYRPRLGATATTRVRIRQLHLYNLDEKAEQDDNVAKVYRKSLLYLVSNAFEDERKLPLLGMQKFTGAVAKDKGLTLFNTGDHSSITQSDSHGGFDNDVLTMNHILGTILGQAPADPFRKEELDYGGA